MPRRSQAIIANPALADLTRQLLFSPEDRRALQVYKTEQLHDQIDPAVEYPLEFAIFRITGYRSEHHQDDLLQGGMLKRDLRLIIDQLSFSLALPPGESLSPRDLARKWDVSVKTLTRWREQGLRWRWVQAQGAKQKSVVYPQAAVELFEKAHPQMLRRAAEFTQMSPPARAQLLARAARLAQAADVSLHQVAAHLAQRTGRAVETVRQILLKHEEENPLTPIFTDRTAPLDPRQKRLIARAYRRGISISKLSRHFRRTRTTLYRAINDLRAQQLRKIDLPCRVLPTFDREDAPVVYLQPLPPEPPASPGRRQQPRRDDLPAPLQKLLDAPALSPQRLMTLLIRRNYLHYAAGRLREQLDKYAPRAADLHRLEERLAQAGALRRELLGAGVPIVLAAARRHLIDQADPTGVRLLELVDAGLVALAQAIDEFDIAGTSTFEKYVSWSLQRRYTALDASRDASPKAHRRVEPDKLIRQIVQRLQSE